MISDVALLEMLTILAKLRKPIKGSGTAAEFETYLFLVPQSSHFPGFLCSHV
jgi:hypothetical protein